MRLHSGYGKLIFVIILPFLAKFKNVVHSLEPGETPSYSPDSNYVQRSKMSQNTIKRLGAVAVWLRLFFQFT